MQTRLIKDNRRNLICFALVVSVLMLITSCANISRSPKIELSTTKFDLGDIDPSDGIRTETFLVKNTGSSLLKITSVSTSCGCTEAEVESGEIQPGESTKLIVNYDPSVHPGLVGKIKRIIYIQSNDPLNEEIELELVGNSMSSEKKPQDEVKIRMDILEGQ